MMIGVQFSRSGRFKLILLKDYDPDKHIRRLKVSVILKFLSLLRIVKVVQVSTGAVY